MSMLRPSIQSTRRGRKVILSRSSIAATMRERPRTWRRLPKLRLSNLGPRPDLIIATDEDLVELGQRAPRYSYEDKTALAMRTEGPRAVHGHQARGKGKAAAQTRLARGSVQGKIRRLAARSLEAPRPGARG